ncbi:MAG TPA: hypothetical protein VNI57_02630 [Candidatus Saccharimonadales bacterium]|nr:hypothetical protein [Candidatus Saccharimonadales bacterium]
MKRTVLALLAACLALAAAAPSSGKPDDVKDSRSLVDTIRGPLEALRGLSFTKPLVTREVTPQEARHEITRILGEEYPPGRLAGEQEAFRYFGFIGPDVDLESTLLDLLEGQVAGLYDPGTRTLFLVKGPLLGSLALAHEMDHALMDQHYDLDRLEKAAMNDDDRSLALSGLVEGEATMVMNLWAVRSSMDPNLPPLTQGSPDDLMAAAAVGLDSAPAYLSDSLMFPYVAGSMWAAEIMKRGGGLKALDPYFLDPPVSTEQILHPEKSVTPRDVPSSIAPSLLDAVLPAGARVIKRDTMGEFSIRSLLGGDDVPSAVDAAGGWDGDRFLLASAGGGRFLTWISVWDSEEDAGEFDDAIGGWLRGRKVPGGFATRRKGQVVLVAEGAPESVPSPEERIAKLLPLLAEGVRLR